MFVVVPQATLFYFLWGGLNLLKMSQERFHRYLLFEAENFGKKTLEHDRQHFFDFWSSISGPGLGETTWIYFSNRGRHTHTLWCRGESKLNGGKVQLVNEQLQVNLVSSWESTKTKNQPKPKICSKHDNRHRKDGVFFFSLKKSTTGKIKHFRSKNLTNQQLIVTCLLFWHMKNYTLY